MKILYVIPNLNVGGVSRVVNDLATGMLEKGYDVTILTLNEHDKLVYISDRIKVIEAHIKSKKSLLTGILKISKIINSEKPDIVHSHTVYSHLFVRMASLFCSKTKYIASEHGTMNDSLSSAIGFTLMKKTNFLSNLLTNVSQSSVDSYIKHKIVKNKQMICVYNGVNFNKFSKKDHIQNINKILYVGRITKEKNLHLLIDILKDIKGQNYVCDIVGDGNQLDKIKDYVLENNLTSKVKFLGKRLDVSEIMKNYDILFLTSFTEGLPTVLIEAIASKILVLTTECGGVKEILEGFEFLVAENNNKMDFLDKFNQLKNTQLNCVVNSLYNAVEAKFSQENMIVSWENVYKNILSK